MKNEKRGIRSRDYELGRLCSKCGSSMSYSYGENFTCDSCGNVERSDFGRVRDYIDENGPSPAIIIHNATGVSLAFIDLLLREGRIEIPDGSSMYIRCKKCGTEIRYGRYCPDCSLAISKEVNGAFGSIDIGEKPTMKGAGGKMRFMKK